MTKHPLDGLDDDIRDHIERETEDNIARGMSPEEARRAALRAFGNVALVREDTRAVWVPPLLDQFAQDVRYAVRLLRRAPGFAAAAILTFALGIGATTTIFSIVDAAVLRPLPYDAADRLVTIRFQSPTTGRSLRGMMPRDFLDWREHASPFEAMTAIGDRAVTLRGAGEPDEVRVASVTADFFAVFRVTPALGRPFTHADEFPGTGQVAIISHGFWQSRFGGADDVVGRTLMLNDTLYEIVGVLPQTFTWPAGASQPSPIFLPMTFRDYDRQRGVEQGMNLSITARLLPGMSIAEAETALSHRQEQLDLEHHPEMPKGFTQVQLTPLLEQYVGTARTWMVMLLGAAAFVLLIACANVANLVLAHATARVRELTVRAALGASRARVARQLLAESLLLSTLGAAAGLAAAWWGLTLLSAAMPATIPRAADIGLDLRVLGFTTLVAVTTGILCGVLPALQGSRVDLVTGLKDGSATGATPRSSQRARHALAWAEIALAVVLLVGAGLFISSFARLLQVDRGFDPSGVTSFAVTLPRTSGEDRTLMPAVLDAVRGVPGVEVALAAGSSAPYEGGFSSFEVRIAGRSLEPGSDGEQIRFRRVSDGYVELLRIPIRRGRAFTPADASGPPIALVNEAAAREFWPDGDAVGGRFTVERVTYEVVGIVGDIRYFNPALPPAPEVFLHYRHGQFGASATFILRTPGGGADVAPAVKAAIWSVAPERAIRNVTTAETSFGRVTAARRFNMLLMSLFAALALVIAATGIYGVIAFVVGQRTREIGIRVALGARSGEVVGQFVRQGAVVLLTGIAAGGVGAWALAHTVEAFLFEVQPRDPLVFGAVALVLAGVGLVACWIPARRAARVDPLTALRAE
jgi:putative ABC transport system permease protein